MINGLQELYKRTVNGSGWPGKPLKLDPNGQPLTHDLLNRLGILDKSRACLGVETKFLERRAWDENTENLQGYESHSEHSPVESVSADQSANTSEDFAWDFLFGDEKN